LKAIALQLIYILCCSQVELGEPIPVIFLVVVANSRMANWLESFYKGVQNINGYLPSGMLLQRASASAVRA